SYYPAQQFINHPIMIVMTPTATGSNMESVIFWQNQISNTLFFRDFTETANLLKKHELYDEVAYISNAEYLFEQQTERIAAEEQILVVGGVFGAITSTLLYVSMHALYFEQFRRKIFIQRILGATFFEIHMKYIIKQMIILIIGYLISVYLFKKIYISLGLLCLFTIIVLVTLIYQSRRENWYSMTVLKGE
ncbi:MAG: DUF1430 domain-containing protein, partial [Gallicola sp.]|nr:DUF1430 domain-containing protein [Gallicola sp.]